MIDSRIGELARRFGIVLPGEDDGGAFVPSAAAILAALGVDVGTDEAVARHLLGTRDLEPPVLRAPPGARCYLPDWLERSRAWGISLQLYEVRSSHNWGIGDFADLAEFCRIAAKAGADFVGTNPLHALFVSDPNRCSPFSPSNRLFLNPLYIAVDQVPGFASGPVNEEAGRRLRSTERVDYDGVARLKIAALRELWRSGHEVEKHSSRFTRESFLGFQDRAGDALRRHALFEALSARMVADGYGCGWRNWPEEFRRADSAAVRRFAEENADEVQFHSWLQWVADVQLAEAAEAARAAGMRIGLYLDFAVGEAPDGSASWSDPEMSVPGMSIGAPPDMFTATGQDWGLAPVSPLAMARTGFAGFRQTNDSLMQHAGALRIDHAMALWQLFFVPEEGSPADGAYVRYPVQRLLGILAEQSLRHRTIVIGEDLGHVPPGFREVMHETGILSYRIVYFEKRKGDFIDGQSYPRLALACLSTHDMPTLTGWWLGDDIALRLDHGLIGPEEAEAQRSERDQDRDALIALLCDEGVLDPNEWAEAKVATNIKLKLPDILAVAAHRFVASTPSFLATVRLADLTGERLQTNLPGTIDSYPNWRLKSSVPIEDLSDAELFGSITRRMQAERPRQV